MGYDINTGEEITDGDRMIHVGLGYYKRASEITEEDRKRRAEWLSSIDSELEFFHAGLEES